MIRSMLLAMVLLGFCITLAGCGTSTQQIPPQQGSTEPKPSGASPQQVAQ